MKHERILDAQRLEVIFPPFRHQGRMLAYNSSPVKSRNDGVVVLTVC